MGESTSNDDDNVARTPNIIIKDLGRRKSNEGLARVASTDKSRSRDGIFVENESHYIPVK